MALSPLDLQVLFTACTQDRIWAGAGAPVNMWLSRLIDLRNLGYLDETGELTSRNCRVFRVTSEGRAALVAAVGDRAARKLGLIS